MYLRLALGAGFILAVLDRFGMLGLPGEANVSWGNWGNFISYANHLMPYFNKNMANFMGSIATLLETVLGIFLIIGYKTKLAAYSTGILTALFAISMLLFSGYRVPFTYSVFSYSAGSFLLALVPYYRWSVDNVLHDNKDKA